MTTASASASASASTAGAGAGAGADRAGAAFSTPSAPSASPAVAAAVTAQQNPGPAPTRLSTPRPKSPRSSSEQPFSSTNNNNPKASSRSSRPKRGSPSPQSNSHRTDPLSDKATVYLIRRILCPQHQDKGKTTPISIEDVLPPLTSRNDVDLQLYALIAIILREYVQNWYSKITPDDSFVAEIVLLIAHVTRALEQRLRKVDLESLLLDELPDLLDRHVTAYRAAHAPITQSPLETDAREIYHALCPLPALSPVPRSGSPASIAEQADNEAAYRQLLVHTVLAVLLPTEDLQNNCLVALVGQIMSELIIGNILVNKLSEPWFIWECFSIASNVITRRRSVENEPLPRRKSKVPVQARPSSSIQSIQALFWTLIQWVFLAISFVRMAITILITSNSLPPRLSHVATAYEKVAAPHRTPQLDLEKYAGSSDVDPDRSKTPLLAFRCWSAMSNLIEMDGRMPWLSGTVSMLQWIMMRSPGRLGGVDGSIDRLLSNAVHKYILDPSGLPPLLRNVRGALFPNNLPGTSSLTAPSSENELLALRRRCAKDLWALISPAFMAKLVGSIYFSGKGGNYSSKAKAAGLKTRPTAATVSTGTVANSPKVVSEADTKKGVAVPGAAAGGASRSTTSRGAANAGSATVQNAAPQNSSQRKQVQGGQTQMEQMRSGSGPRKSGLDQGQQQQAQQQAAVVVSCSGSAATSTTAHQQGSGLAGPSESLSSLSLSFTPGPGPGPGSTLGYVGSTGRKGSASAAPSLTAGITTTTSSSNSDARSSGIKSTSSSSGNNRNSSKLSLTAGGNGNGNGNGGNGGTTTNDAAIRAAASATKNKLAKRVEDSQDAHHRQRQQQQLEQELLDAAAAADAGAGGDHAAAGGKSHGGDNNEVDEDEDEETILAEIEQGILDVFSDAYLNKHLIYSMLELILVRLMPELAEKKVSELWEERLA